MPIRTLFTYIVDNVIVFKQLILFSAIAAIPGIAASGLVDWYIVNSTYIRIVMGAVIVDHLFGTLVHLFWKKDFSILKNLVGLGLKVFVLMCMGTLFEGLAHLTIEEDLFYKYLKMMTRLLVFAYPARSAMINCSTITGGRFPPKILIEGFTKFGETLDTGAIINKQGPKREDNLNTVENDTNIN